MTDGQSPMSAAQQSPATVAELTTPALVIDKPTFDANCAAMDAVLPGLKLRPHVKAFKSTDLARQLADAGHTAFCAATVRELEGMAAAGLDHDLLLANQTLDAPRLAALSAQADVTIAIDSDETLQAAIDGGVKKVLIDVEVGMPRCGCSPEEAPRLAEKARAAGIDVRGVMGYEGHLMMVMDRESKARKVERAMAILLEAHEKVGGDVVSGGGTGTFDINTWVTEIQAGSYVVSDTHYDQLDSPFKQAMSVVATVISVNSKGWAVVDAGLKAFGLDHGEPTWPDGTLMFCSDEHSTLAQRADDLKLSVGDRVMLRPAHVDPTVARHEQFWVTDGDTIVDRWAIDLRHW